MPFTARCGNTSCEQASYSTTYYQLANAVSGTRARTTRAFHRTFYGLEITARRRLANRWMLNGSVNWNSAIYRSSPDGFLDTINPDLFVVAALPSDPTNREFIEGEQTLINGARWTAKLSGLYQLPGGINVSGALNARDGFPFIPNVLSPARTGRLGTIRVMVEPYATHRYDALLLLDLKAEKALTLRKAKVIASIDVFNVTNANTVLNRVTTQNSSLANNVLEITGPRVMRFGARFTF